MSHEGFEDLNSQYAAERQMHVIKQLRELSQQIALRKHLLENYMHDVVSQFKEMKETPGRGVNSVRSEIYGILKNTCIPTVVLKGMEMVQGNYKARRIFCAPHEYLEGKKLADYLSAHDARSFYEAFTNRESCINIEFVINSWQGLRHCRGNLVYSSILDEFVLLFKDITAKNRMAEQLDLQSSFHDTLSHALTSIHTVTNNNLLRIFLEDITADIVKWLNIEHCHVCILSDHKLIYASHPLKEDLKQKCDKQILNYWLSKLRYFPLHYIHRGFTTSSLEDQFLDANKLGSAIILPIPMGSQVPGYLCVGSKHTGSWASAEKLLRNITAIISLALRKTALHTQIEVAKGYYGAEKQDQYPRGESMPHQKEPAEYRHNSLNLSV